MKFTGIRHIEIQRFRPPPLFEAIQISVETRNPLDCQVLSVSYHSRRLNGEAGHEGAFRGSGPSRGFLLEACDMAIREAAERTEYEALRFGLNGPGPCDPEAGEADRFDFPTGGNNLTTIDQQGRQT